MTDTVELLPTYDAGLLSDFGGGNVYWWQNYIRAELGRAHDFYAAQFEATTVPKSVADGLAEALGNSAAMLGAVYQWLDKVNAAGGATSISGIAACNAMLKSIEGNRSRAEKLVMEPTRNALTEYRKATQ
jgi:predicted enzyme related to lactoylglutathione lyase